ncbi:MAG: hypothetical protein QXG56_02880 [Candidatus Bathyarchaeia archaeon]
MKKEFLELLDKDVEFRYAVAGYLGLLEVLKKLDGLAEEQRELRREQTRLREEQTKIWMEIKVLREEQMKLREEQTKIWAEIEKIWEEVKALREEQMKLREEQTRLREDMVKGFRRLDARIDSLESGMISGFGELSRFAGLTFEEFVRKFLTARLRKSGEIPEQAELRKGVIDEEEINIFLEEPLIVGEATGYADSTEEILKLLRKAEIAKVKYSKEPRKILVILSAKREVAGQIEKIADKESIELIIGKTTD